MLHTANPVFNSPTYQDAGPVFGAMAEARPATMTVRGTALKTLYLVLITAVSAAATWGYFINNPGAIMPVMIGSLVGTFVAGIVMLKAARWASYIVPVFAFGEGIFLAAISIAILHHSRLADRVGSPEAAQALVGQAAGLTLAIAAAMLLGYASGVLRLGGVVKKVIIVLTAGVALYYIVGFVGNLAFGRQVIPMLTNDASPLGIGFSVFVVALASLNLVLDFQFVEEGVKRGLPRHMEWVAAFGLLTTLVWLYIELLRLLAKLRR